MMKKNRNRKSNKRSKPSALCRATNDWISDLPDSILEHIISFLDAKDAVMTSVLSKRWESLWTSTPNLLFYCKYRWQESKVQSFASFVDKTLMRHSSSKIKKFLLQCHCRYIPKDQFELWLRFAASHEPEELCLQLTFSIENEQYEWHGALASSMRKWWFMEVLEGFSGRSLKVLSLTHTILRSDKLRSILLGSPFLECLILRECQLYNRDVDVYDDGDVSVIVDASHTSLKELVLDTHRSVFDAQRVNISAPNLLLLTIAGYTYNVEFKLIDVSSLVEANVDLMALITYDEEKEMLKDLVQNLIHVNKFTIGIRCLQEDGSVRKAIIAKFPTATRKILEIDMESTKGYLCGLSSLLCNLHDLEKLTINLMPSDYHEFEPDDIFGGDIEIDDTIDPFPMMHLKSINITGFAAGSCASSDKVLVEMVQHLLANAKILQKLIVYAEIDNLTFAKPETFRKLFEISQKLLSYPRASSDAVVLFEGGL